jgi:DNA (cytosine-5)-methyltransferase 1
MNAQNADSSGNAPTVISTFAGCGGSSLGYKLAGFHELLAVEWDDNAVATFRLNFPDVPVYHGDIAKLTGAECMRLAGLSGPGELDVLDGSPPCQGFSTAGKRKFDDPRNSLFKEFARLISELQPKVFVMENVTGMVKGCMKQAYLTIIKTLRECGYRAKGEVLNAMYYNVPQSRERVIIIGVRKDLGIEPSHPKPQTRPITCKMSIGDLENEPVDLPFNPETKIARVMRTLKHGNSDPAHQSHVKIPMHKPCPTLLKDFLGYMHFWHYSQFRPLLLAEWKRLGSFPDDFRFTDKKEGCQRIGNSVPPNLMRAIAEHVRDKLLTPTPALQPQQQAQT